MVVVDASWCCREPSRVAAMQSDGAVQSVAGVFQQTGPRGRSGIVGREAQATAMVGMGSAGCGV